MLNALIQLSTLIYGLVFNFVVPSIYGLDAYGEFIANNAMIFLLYRAMAIIGEPLIRFTTPRMLLANSLTLNGMVFVVFLIANHWFRLGSPQLLAGLLVNGSCLLAMQGMRLRRSYITFLVAMSCSYVALMGWSATHGLALSIMTVATISMCGLSVICLVYLFTQGAVLPSLRELKETIGQVLYQCPRIISITAVMNMLTSALPVFLAPILSPHDMGLFKVMTSVIQSAAIVFPVSTQAVLTSFVIHPRGVEFYRLLSSIATFYFAAVCAGLVACALLVPKLVPYVGLAACLPVYYQAILLERHLTATHRIRVLAAVNWAIVIATGIAVHFVMGLEQAVLVYAAGFTLYAVALGVADRDFKPYPPLLFVLLLCPLFVSLMLQHLTYGLVYALMVAAVAGLRHLPTRSDIVLLWKEL